MDNKITLSVEGSPVAWGELLVLGDKFGIRVKGIHETIEDAVEHHAIANQPKPPQHKEQASDMEQPEDTMDTPDGSQEGNENTEEEFLNELELDESDFGDVDEDEDW